MSDEDLKDSEPVEKQVSDDAEENQATDDVKVDGDENTESVDFVADDFSLPDGVEFDTALFESVAPIVKDLKISKDGMQKLVDAVGNQRLEAQEAQMQEWSETRSKWRDVVKSDEEIGGNKLDEKMSVVERAMNRYGSRELKEFGEAYGWTDHPEFIRMMYRIGKNITEGQSGNTDGALSKQESIESRWYGETTT